MQKQKLYPIVILCLTMMVMAACHTNPDAPVKRHQRPLLVPAASGNPYEVMVVTEDSLWDGYAGKALRAILNKPLPMLPQEESMFHVSHIRPEKLNRITNLFRNIVILKTSEYTTTPKMTLERDVYASPQLIMTLQGPDANELSTYITEQTQSIIKAFVAEEINRNCYLLEDEHNIKFNKAVKEMFGCELYIPVDLLKMKIGDDFIWASNDGVNTIQNVCIYSYPYVSEKVFTQHSNIALRDTFMRRNIQGIHPDQYMTTDHDFVQCRAINVLGRYVLETRGLWRMENDMMGGPFISHATVDTVNNKVIVVEGFVYAPEKMKRTMIRRLEAALYTLRLPNSDIDNNKK